MIRIKWLVISISLILILATISLGMVIISYNYNLSVGTQTQKIYMETGPGYGNTHPPYPPTNSLSNFAVDGITSVDKYIITNKPIYINYTGPPSPNKIEYVLEIVNNTNIKNIPINIYFNTSYENVNNELPSNLAIYYSTKSPPPPPGPPGPQYTQITPGQSIHLTTPAIYISFTISSGTSSFSLYLIFVIGGVIIQYSYPVYLNE
jgi:hypothetical protein